MPVCRNSSSGELATPEVWHGSYADAVHASFQLRSSPTEKKKKEKKKGVKVCQSPLSPKSIILCTRHKHTRPDTFVHIYRS